MDTKKTHIIAMLNGVPQGYIKSVSYKNGKFKLIQNKYNAKGYTKLDILQSDIDFLTKYNNHKGYIFIYD